ncbi:hypothetical protein RclHR1_05510006 [Rhizophagus clarus]|uniref:MIR domain-containing protein n=1 Tax=Rhizophagus clarus TaxID=94130 RepID=A0A2Z6S047_9GLOM|nr:hypothetical protein RclHR1_05510006 [Rhizophagus clarus]GES94990.1 hypothetical protein GLOIN_2v1767391 [Rhizophagus clarus]
MDLPKYDGNIHPNEWIKDLRAYYSFKGNTTTHHLNIQMAILLVDSTIKLPTGINNIENLCDALKEDISFTIFKNTNKRKLQSLEYISERIGGDTSKFISTFRKLCYNAELNDIEEQKRYLFKSLPNNHFDYISNEFYERMKNVNSIDELAKEFEDIVLEESNLIRNGSIVALKHVASGKYLSSISNLCYITGSRNQMVCVGSSEPDPNSLWKINSSKELITYTDIYVNLHLQHVKSNNYLALSGCYSPSTNHSEVICRGNAYYWDFKHSKLENHQGYLKSNDTINLYYSDNGYIQSRFLRSHDIQFTIGNDTFQEVVCHSERLGGNDEWCIELIHEVKIF